MWVLELEAESREASTRALARRQPSLMRSSIPIQGLEIDINSEENSCGERSGTV
jgi:hypothetical protein